MKTSPSLLRSAAFAAAILFTSLALPAVLRAEAVTEAWVTRDNGPIGSDDQPAAIAVDSAGNVAVTGRSFNGATNDFYTAKYRAADGLPLWPAGAGRTGGAGISNDEPHAIAVDSAGHVIVTGESSFDGNTEYLTVKYDAADGQVVWEKRFDALPLVPNQNIAVGVVVDSAGNVIVTGNTTGPDYTTYTIKYAAGNGDTLWVHFYDLTPNASTTYAIAWAHSLAVDGAGNAIVTGYSVSGSSDFLTIKLDATDGHQLWERRTDANGFAYSVAVNSAGDVAVTGYSQFGSENLYTAKYRGTDGAVLWERRKEDARGFGSSVAMDTGGNVAVTGQIYDSTNFHSQFYTAKYAANGTLMWEVTHGLDAVGYTVKMDANGNVLVTGQVSNGTNLDFYTAKYASAGGTLLWEKSYNGPDNGDDQMYRAIAPYSPQLALTADYGVVITGHSTGAGTGQDYATIRYSQPVPLAPTLLQEPIPSAGDQFGHSVASSGTLVVVGAPGSHSGPGSVGSAYVFDLSSAIPTVPVATLHNPSPDEFDSFGSSVAISGNRVVVGAPSDSVGGIRGGSAYVYEINAVTPVLVATLHNPTPGEGTSGDNTPDFFGSSVAISGTRVVVGAFGDDAGVKDAGIVYVYDLGNFGLPTLVATLNDPNPSVVGWFGHSVAISGSRVVVGAAWDDTGHTDAGSAYVYALSGATPTVPVATLRNPSPASIVWFGWSVAVSGTRVVVGAPDTSLGLPVDAPGSAYVYDLGSLTPTVPMHTLDNPDPSRDAGFGGSVAISDTRVVVGVGGNDAGAKDSGSAYVYDLSGATPIVPVLTLQNPTPAAEDYFGSSVAISGTQVVVGAPGDDTGGTDAGSAYFYHLDSGTAPVAFFLTGPGTPTNSTSATFTFSGTDDATPPADLTFESSLDGALPFTAAISPVTIPGPLAEGTHTFAVRAIDAALNVGPPVTFTWVVDTTPPQTTILSGPPATTTSTDATLTFAASEAGATFKAKFDTDPFATATSGVSRSGLGVALHTFTVYATDRAGNVGASVTHSWTIGSSDVVLTVVRAGFQPVPGRGVDPRIPGDALFATFREPAIDDAGRLAYYATWSSRAEGAGGGIFVDDTLIAAIGQAAPVAGPTLAAPFYTSFKDPVMSGDGRIAFIATLGSARGGGVSAANNSVIVTNAFDAGGALEIVAREDRLATNGPNTIVGRWKSFESVSLQSAAGQHGLLFTAYLKTNSSIPHVTASNDLGAWLRTESRGPAPFVVVREDDPVPGLAGRFIKSFDLLRALNTAGSHGHGRGHFLAENVDVPVALYSAQALTQGLLRRSAGAATFAPRTGDPGPIAGTLWQSVRQMSRGTAAGGSFGVVLGALQVGVGGVTSANAGGIFSIDDNGAATVLMRADDPAPGLAGVFLKSFKYPVASATSFSAAVPAELTGNGISSTNKSALLWKPEGGNVEILARAGDQPPNALAGVRWGGKFSLALPGGPIGPIFTDKLAGTGVTASNNIALYAVDSAGELRELLREGQQLLTETVSAFRLLSPLAGTTGATRSFNNAGQIALLVEFTTRKRALVRIDVP